MSYKKCLLSLRNLVVKVENLSKYSPLKNIKKVVSWGVFRGKVTNEKSKTVQSTFPFEKDLQLNELF